MISYLSLTDSPYGQIGFDFHTDGGRSKDHLLYQQLAIFCRFKLPLSLHNLSTDLAKPFWEVIILMFEIGEHPPSTSGKTQ
jgi:hypothetical protein